MDNNDNRDYCPPIDTEKYFYIGDDKGFALCHTHFETPMKAATHYKKCMKKVNYPVFVCTHTVTVGEEIKL